MTFRFIFGLIGLVMCGAVATHYVIDHEPARWGPALELSAPALICLAYAFNLRFPWDGKS